jgi:hypothetical protein
MDVLWRQREIILWGLRVVITIDLFGDKQYAELLYRTIDNNIPKKMDNMPTTTDNIHKTTTSDK